MGKGSGGRDQSRAVERKEFERRFDLALPPKKPEVTEQNRKMGEELAEVAARGWKDAMAAYRRGFGEASVKALEEGGQLRESFSPRHIALR